MGSRLWLATAVARRREGLLVPVLLRRTRPLLADRAVLLAVDGFASYVSAARTLIRVPARTGRQGADHPEYQPDFVAESTDAIYILEPKASNQMDDPVVLAKRDAAVK